MTTRHQQNRASQASRDQVQAKDGQDHEPRCVPILSQLHNEQHQQAGPSLAVPETLKWVQIYYGCLRLETFTVLLVVPPRLERCRCLFTRQYHPATLVKHFCTCFSILTTTTSLLDFRPRM